MVGLAAVCLSGKGLARYLNLDPFPAPPHKNCS